MSILFIFGFMSFAKRNPIIRRFFSLGVNHRELSRKEDGSVEFKSIDDCGPMPNPEHFRLDYQLATGMNLQDVGTRVLGTAGLLLETANSFGISPDDFVNEDNTNE